MDEHVEVTSVSWFGRILESLKSVLVGLLLFFVSFPVLWWNEGRAVQTARSLDEGAGLVVSAVADKVDGASEGKLVHVSGLAHTADELRDDDFGIVEKAIRLRRAVEMYQWVESEKSETRKKPGGGEEKTTVYRYELKWSPKWEDSKEFKEREGHENPRMSLEELVRQAQNVQLGAFALPAEMVAQIEGETPVALDVARLAKVTPVWREKTQVAGGAFHVRPDGGTFKPDEPALGDLRIRYSIVPAAEVSVVAQQIGSSFRPYQTRAGDPLSLVHMGRHTAEQMFSQAKAENETLTWVLRGVGFFLMAIGIFFVFRPLSVVADIVPFFGGLLRAGVALLALLLALPLTLLTLAIAWIAVRPLLGAALFAGVAAALVAAVLLARRGRAAARA